MVELYLDCVKPWLGFGGSVKPLQLISDQHHHPRLGVDNLAANDLAAGVI